MAVFECVQALVVILDAIGDDARLDYPTERVKGFLCPYQAERLEAEPAPLRR